MPSILGPDGRPVSAERVRMEKQTRFNPISNWGPDVLVRQLVAYARGEIAPLSWVMEWLETHDEVIQTVAPKAKAAVSRYGYDILMKDEVRPDLQGMAEDQQGRVQEFYQDLRATDAADQETGGGTRLLFQQVMDAYGKGYAAHHIVWNPGTTLSAELVKVPTWFFEVKTGRLQFLPSTWALDGVPLDSMGGRGAWMVSRGRGVMLAGTIARMFKQIPLQDWLTYCDRHGMPAFLGKTKAPKGSVGWNDMAQAVGSIGSEWGAVVNVDDVIDVLDLKGSGELPYEKLVDRMDRAQVMLWRGGDLSTISRGGGAVGANPQSEETDELDADNAAWISETLQRNLTEQVVRYHFGQNAPVLVEIKLRTKTRNNVRQDMASVKLAKDFGVRVSRAWFTKKFGIVEAEKNEAALGDVEIQDVKTQDARQEAVANAAAPAYYDPRDFPGDETGDPPKWLAALADDMQPLGKALAAAMQAGDDEAVTAALRKISETLPEFLDTPGLEEWMDGAMAAALLGDAPDAPDAANARRNTPQPKGGPRSLYQPWRTDVFGRVPPDGSHLSAQDNFERASKAVAWALRNKESVEGIAFVPGLGRVDLPWGRPGHKFPVLKDGVEKTHTDGMGLSHIVDKHGWAAAANIPRILAHGEVMGHTDPLKVNMSLDSAILILSRENADSAITISSYDLDGPGYRTEKPLREAPAPMPVSKVRIKRQGRRTK